MSSPLIMAWGMAIGLVTFFVSAIVYPRLGVPPMWLMGCPLVAIIYVLCRETWGEKR
jgi:predicted PurR-regulated permease PerM